MAPEMRSPVTEVCTDAGVQRVVTRKGVARDNVKTMSKNSELSLLRQVGVNCVGRESRKRDEGMQCVPKETHLARAEFRSEEGGKWAWRGRWKAGLEAEVLTYYGMRQSRECRAAIGDLACPKLGWWTNQKR